MMYLSKVTRPGTFTWSLGMKLRFICCDGVPRCQTLGSERASRYAASADRLEAWQFTEVPAVELRDDAMCQVTKVCLQGCNITPAATNIALRPKPNRSAFDSSKHCRNFSNPQWFASLFTLVQHKFTSHTERALQFRLTAVDVDTKRSGPVCRLGLAITTSPSPTERVVDLLCTHHRRLWQACKARTCTDQGRKGPGAIEELPS